MAMGLHVRQGWCEWEDTGSEAAGQMVEPPTKKRRLGPELNVLHALALHMQTFHPLTN